jgi:hypothetical protein
MTSQQDGRAFTVVSQVAGSSREDTLAAESYDIDAAGYLRFYAGSSTATGASPLATFAPGWTAVLAQVAD